MKKSKEETNLKNNILEASFFYPNDVSLWKMNVGAAVYEGKNGKKRFVRFGFKGLSDILGIHKIKGKLIAIECKIWPNTLEPAQEDFRELVISSSGIYVLAYELEDWKQVLI